MKNGYKKLKAALELRKNKQLEESKEMLLELVQESNDALILLECAKAHDMLGLEMQAIPYYEQAIKLGLPEQERMIAYTNLGSSLRCVGEYERAEEVLSQAEQLFPNDEAIKVFLAMSRYNLGKTTVAMQELLHVLVRLSKSEDIRGYQRAIAFYADHLDQTWQD